MQTDTDRAKLCLTDWKIQATLPVSLRYATGYFMISHGLLWLTQQTLTAGERVQSSANVTLTNRVRRNIQTAIIHTLLTLSTTESKPQLHCVEIGIYRRQSSITLQSPIIRVGILVYSVSYTFYVDFCQCPFLECVTQSLQGFLQHVISTMPACARLVCKYMLHVQNLFIHGRTRQIQAKQQVKTSLSQKEKSIFTVIF